jgi:protein import protein ZIM17
MKITKTIKTRLIKQNPITKFVFSSKPLLSFSSKEEQALLNKETIINTVQFHISGIDHNQIKGAKKGDSRLYVVSFECKICNKRNTKTCTHTAYHKGLVVIRCDDCSSYHLIAENLGWVRSEKKEEIERIYVESKDDVGKVCLKEKSLVSCFNDLSLSTEKKRKSKYTI